MEDRFSYEEKITMGKEGVGIYPTPVIFIEEYVISRDVLDAARRAGYACKTSYSAYAKLKAILKKPEAKAYMEKLEEDLRLRNKITQDYLVAKLKELIETPLSRIKPADKINAINTLAKIAGFLKEQDSGRVVVFQVAGLEPPIAQGDATLSPPGVKLLE